MIMNDGMIELSGAALDAVAGGKHGADDLVPQPPQAPEAPEVQAPQVTV